MDFTSYEGFCQWAEDPLLQLQYKILFRRWDKITEEQWEDSDRWMEYPAIKLENDTWQDSGYKLKDLVAWNSGYIHKYLNQNYQAETALKVLENDLEKEQLYYTDLLGGTEKNILEIFFCGAYPILNVEKYPLQQRPAEKLKNFPYHLIFDEVGTGKTVSALYCIADTIREKGQEAKILVLCPHNKKDDWANDIRRQLGMYAHKENGDKKTDVTYQGSRKEHFFKEKEPAIFVFHQMKEMDEKEKVNQFHRWSEKETWDLIVIDEGHLCFNNYGFYRGKKAVLLTATPVVVKKDGENWDVRTFDRYGNDLAVMTEQTNYQMVPNLFQEKEVFTQLFREDLGILATNRKIIFEECQRWEDRGFYLNALKIVQGGNPDLLYEQDDQYLMEKISENKTELEELFALDLNDLDGKIFGKRDKLLEFLNKNPEKSYIIFFEHISPADKIYEFLSRELKDSLVVKKFGSKNSLSSGESVESDQLLDHMKARVLGGDRVLFLTTGATGGTGLNLGPFHGTINYELPFTAIELEQRFGRVDRVDARDASQTKEMVFLLNDDQNPMLRYSATKIHLTCCSMPIRNTVLFHPEYIAQVLSSIELELKQLLGGDEALEIYKNYIELRKKEGALYGDKQSDFEQEVLRKGGNVAFSLDIVNEELESQRVFLSNLDNLMALQQVHKGYCTLLRLEEEVENWKNLLGSEHVTELDVTHETRINEKEFQEEKEVGILSEVSQKEGALEEKIKELHKGLSEECCNLLVKWQEVATKLQGLVNKTLPSDTGEQRGEVSSSGVFYMKPTENGGWRYCKETVADYRNTDAWSAVWKGGSDSEE